MQFRAVHLLLALSIALNVWFSIKLQSKRGEGQQNTQDPQKAYPYLSARILAENKNDTFVGFMPLREQLRKYVSENGPETIRFYFEYLPSGSSIGINEKEEFPLASLFKVPIVIGAYELIESGKITSDTIVTIRESDLDMTSGRLWEKGAGTKLTVKEAIDLTLIESDNTAVHVLYNLLPPEKIIDLFQDLDVQIGQAEDGFVYAIGSAKSYSSILRALYLSIFLTKDHSNEILEMLTRTKFNDRLQGGIPNDIKVAHKIGDYKRNDTGGFVFSDCGIVYVPKRPYILCIMGQGSEEEAKEHISFLSRMVYGYISQINIRPSEEGF